METFGDWLNRELEDRAWGNSDLARAAGLQPSTLSRIISGDRGIGPDACLGIARALRIQPEKVFRKAGLLPALPSAVADEQEAISLLRQLPARTRETIMTMLRALAGRHAYYAVSESATAYETGLERQLLEAFRRLDDRWQEVTVQDMEYLADRPLVRMVGEDDLRAHTPAPEEAPAP
jgi:transcriptional regulator with XRE-family HTH domain